MTALGDAAVLDACVLYPASLRDLLIRLSRAGFFRARWSHQILDEMLDNLVENGGHDRERLGRTRTLMIRAIDESLVEGYEPLVDGLVLPDPDDRHVLAAAIHAGAGAIVTHNTKDFPESALRPHGIRLIRPDEFVHEFILALPDQVLEVIRGQRADLKNPPYSPDQLIGRFQEVGLERTARFLRDHADRI